MAGKDPSIGINTTLFFNANGMITIEECIDLPLVVHSQGLWNYIHMGTLPFPLPLIQLQMVLIFTLTQVFHYILKRYGLPKFTTQLLVGIILGPSLLGRLRIFKMFCSRLKVKK
ncbi:hypothetical protein SLA2020_265260 [Shorea laevis]